MSLTMDDHVMENSMTILWVIIDYLMTTDNFLFYFMETVLLTKISSFSLPFSFILYHWMTILRDYIYTDHNRLFLSLALVFGTTCTTFLPVPIVKTIATVGGGVVSYVVPRHKHRPLNVSVGDNMSSRRHPTKL